MVIDGVGIFVYKCKERKLNERGNKENPHTESEFWRKGTENEPEGKSKDGQTF